MIGGHMNWRTELEKFEQNNDWKSAIQLADRLMKNNPNEVDIYIRIIFILLDLLVDGYCSQKEHDQVAIKLKEYFDKSYSQFSDNAEYLFFMGHFIPIAEWYFGMKNVSEAYDLRKKAMEKEPNNILYEWSYRFSDPDDRLAGYFSEQLLTHDTCKIDWLNSKGIAGKYIIGMIEYCYRNYKG